MKNKSKCIQEDAENLCISKPHPKDCTLKNSKPIRIRPFGKDLLQHPNPTPTILTAPNHPPQHTYLRPIITHLLSRNVNYHIETRTIASSISYRKRAVLVQFLLESAEQFSLRKDTLYLAVYLMDRYITRGEVQAGDIVNIAYACLLIASKYEEIYPPLLQEYSSKDSRQAIIQTQAKILKLVDFDLTYTSPSKYLHIWADILQLNDLQLQSSQILLDICLFDVKWLGFSPSVLAASSITISGRLANAEINVSKLGEYLDMEDVKSCNKAVLELLGDCRRYMKYVRDGCGEDAWRRLFCRGQ